MRERDQRVAERVLLADASDPLPGLFAGEAQLLLAPREEPLDVALAARAARVCSPPILSRVGEGRVIAACGSLRRVA